VRRLRERGVDRGLVAERPGVALVARRLVVDLRRAGLQRVGGIHDRGQHLVVDLDHLGRVLRLVRGLRDHQRDVVADVAHLALGQHPVRRLLHRRAVDAGDEPAAGEAVHALEVRAGEDRDYARRGLRARGVDLADARVRVRRAQEIRVRLVRLVDVVGELSRAGEEADILLALDRLADHARVVRAHGPLTFPSRRRPASPP
jgi:hypothetical protein